VFNRTPSIQRHIDFSNSFFKITVQLISDTNWSRGPASLRVGEIIQLVLLRIREDMGTLHNLFSYTRHVIFFTFSIVIGQGLRSQQEKSLLHRKQQYK